MGNSGLGFFSYTADSRSILCYWFFCWNIWLSIFNITKPIMESIEYLLLKILTSYLLVTSCISSYNLERSEILLGGAFQYFVNFI